MKAKDAVPGMLRLKHFGGALRLWSFWYWESDSSSDRSKLGSSASGTSPLRSSACVLIGQRQITIPPNVKSVFLQMFFCAVGYGMGPQVFRGLKSDGLPQVLFAIMRCVTILLLAFVAAKLAVYHADLAAVLGVATGTINQFGLPPEPGLLICSLYPQAPARQELLDRIRQQG